MIILKLVFMDNIEYLYNAPGVWLQFHPTTFKKISRIHIVSIVRQLTNNQWTENIEVPDGQCCFLIDAHEIHSAFILYNGESWQPMLFYGCSNNEFPVFTLSMADKLIIDEYIKQYLDRLIIDEYIKQYLDSMR